ncbi:MAG: TMEM165/GDT1 family protein [Thermostichales cyanobacterium SZTDM-1c_bins_54]
MWEGLMASLLLVTAAEFGDKTFFIALILAMRHPRYLVFWGSWLALVAMSLLAVVVGKVIIQWVPIWLMRWAAVGLFLGFGGRMLWQAWKMPPHQDHCEVEEVLELVEEKESGYHPQRWGVFWEAFSLTAMSEWGDKTQLATVSLAAIHPAVAVFGGSLLGYSVMVAVAVVGGQMLAQRISERMVQWLGGSLFLAFGILTAIDIFR